MENLLVTQKRKTKGITFIAKANSNIKPRNV